MERSLHSVESAVESIHRLIAHRLGEPGPGPTGSASTIRSNSPLSIPAKRPLDYANNRLPSNDGASNSASTPKRCQSSARLGLYRSILELNPCGWFPTDGFLQSAAASDDEDDGIPRTAKVPFEALAQAAAVVSDQLNPDEQHPNSNQPPPRKKQKQHRSSNSSPTPDLIAKGLIQEPLARYIFELSVPCSPQPLAQTKTLTPALSLS